MIAERLCKLSVFGLAFVIVVGCGKNNEPLNSAFHQGAPSMPGRKATNTSNRADRISELALTAEQFADDCKKDRDAANAKYEGKVIELSGVIDFVGIWWQDGKPDFFSKGVLCFTAEREPWARVAPGQTFKVKGKYGKMNYEVVGLAGENQAHLLDCVFLDLGPNPTIAISAEELSKEYGANKDKAQDKYRKKFLIVDGEIASIKTKDYYSDVLLKGHANGQVNCTIEHHLKGNHKQDMVNRLKVGERVRIFGEFHGGPEERVSFYSCLVIQQGK